MSSTLSRPILRTVAIVIGLGLLTAWASMELRLHTRLDTIHNMSNILHGRPMEFGDATSTIHPFYNRIMFPTVLLGLTHGVGVMSEGQWYILLRLGSFILAFAAFALACVRGLRPPTDRVHYALVLLGMSSIGAFAFPWEDPTDMLDVIGQCLAVLVALDGRFALCLLIALVFATNRESSAYAGLTWFVLAPPRPLPRRGIETVVICVAAYALALGLRAIFSKTGAQNWFSLPHNIESFIEAARHGAIISWFGVWIGVTLFLTACVDYRPPMARKFVLLAALFMVPGLLFGWVEDVRVYLPCMVMMCFAVAVGKEA